VFLGRPRNAIAGSDAVTGIVEADGLMAELSRQVGR